MIKTKPRRMVREPVSAVPPATGWRLLAQRSFSTATKVFSRGCEVSPNDLGRNLRAMIDNGFVRSCPPGTPITATARERPIPQTEPAKPKPKIKIIVLGDDVIGSWHATVKEMTKRCGGNGQRARDLLMIDNAGSELFCRAQRIACLQEAKRRGVVSISPDQLPVPL
jgi:hypothetical protein